MKRYILLMLIIFVFLPVPLVNAQDEINISNVPQALADALGFDLFVGQILASSLLLSFFLFPVMLLTNKRTDQYVAVLIVGIVSLSLCVAMGWLPLLVLLLILLITSGIVGVKFKSVFT